MENNGITFENVKSLTRESIENPDQTTIKGFLNMNTQDEGLKSVVYDKLDELFPDYDSWSNEVIKRSSNGGAGLKVLVDKFASMPELIKLVWWLRLTAAIDWGSPGGMDIMRHVHANFADHVLSISWTHSVYFEREVEETYR